MCLEGAPWSPWSSARGPPGGRMPLYRRLGYDYYQKGVGLGQTANGSPSANPQFSYLVTWLEQSPFESARSVNH
jgi:hypothetical protein